MSVMPAPAGPPFPPTHPLFLFQPDVLRYLITSPRQSLTAQPLRLNPPSHSFFHEPTDFPPYRLQLFTSEISPRSVA